MRKDRLHKTAIRYLSAALVLALLLVAVGVPPAAAQEISDYYEFDYEPVQFVDAQDNPKTDIDGYETFYARLRGNATCIQDLPDEYQDVVTGLKFRLRITAEHDEGGGGVTLNYGYTITIEPLPTREGESAEIDERIPLKFPGGSESGTYHISAELSQAWAKVYGSWHRITDEIPEEYRTMPLGDPVEYTAPPNSAPNPPGSPSPPNGATGVSLPVSLSVRVVDIDNDAMTVTFFDASDDSVIGTVAGVASGSRAEVSWPGLAADTTYNWYAEAHDGAASEESDTWSFSTQAPVNNPPNTPSNPSPANDATGVSIYVDLTWTGGDHDAGDTVTYDVHFGTSPSPPLQETVGPYPATQSSVTYDPGTLAPDTRYYWKIVARDNHGLEVEGPVWSFTTALEGNGEPVAGPPVEEGLASIVDELVIVYIWRPATQTWDMYWPEASIDTIETLEAGKAYWILADSDCVLEYGTRSYELYAGWNNIAWLPQ